MRRRSASAGLLSLACVFASTSAAGLPIPNWSCAWTGDDKGGERVVGTCFGDWPQAIKYLTMTRFQVTALLGTPSKPVNVHTATPDDMLVAEVECADRTIRFMEPIHGNRPAHYISEFSVPEVGTAWARLIQRYCKRAGY